MKSPMEVVVGRDKNDWRRRDRWTLRLLVGVIGLFSFYVLRGLLVVLQGTYGAPPAPLLYIWGFLSTLCLMVLVERKIRLTTVRPGDNTGPIQ
jgi:hypothetical protein